MMKHGPHKTCAFGGREEKDDLLQAWANNWKMGASPKTGMNSIIYPYWGNQTIEMYGNFEGFPVPKALVSYNDPCLLAKKPMVFPFPIAAGEGGW